MKAPETERERATRLQMGGPTDDEVESKRPPFREDTGQQVGHFRAGEITRFPTPVVLGVGNPSAGGGGGADRGSGGHRTPPGWGGPSWGRGENRGMSGGAGDRRPCGE